MMYFLMIPLFFFDSKWYLNFPRVRPIHSYVCGLLLLLNLTQSPCLTSSESCDTLIMWSSFISMFTLDMIQMIVALGALSGSFCVRIDLYLGVIMNWTRLLLDNFNK